MDHLSYMDLRKTQTQGGVKTKLIIRRISNKNKVFINFNFIIFTMLHAAFRKHRWTRI